MNTVAILGIGVVTPGVDSPETLAGLAALSAPPIAETAAIAPPEGMTARDQRRQARLTRLALYAADRAAAHAGVRGRDAGIYMGLTHGTATFLKEFHDYLFDYGPEMASPNAFSNGVTNAPLGAISLHQKLSQGGATLVGVESCGLDTLEHAADKILDGTHELCYAGACEEYSPLVADVYRRLGWHDTAIPASLPCPLAPGRCGVGLSEGAVVCVLGPQSSPSSAPSCQFSSVNISDPIDTAPDLIISNAGGGPADAAELDVLSAVLARAGRPIPVLFSKAYFGETFAVGPLLGLAMAWSVLHHRARFTQHPIHESLASYATQSYDPARIGRVLIVAAGRDGSVAAGVVSAAPISSTH